MLSNLISDVIWAAIMPLGVEMYPLESVSIPPKLGLVDLQFRLLWLRFNLRFKFSFQVPGVLPSCILVCECVFGILSAIHLNYVTLTYISCFIDSGSHLHLSLGSFQVLCVLQYHHLACYVNASLGAVSIPTKLG